MTPPSRPAARSARPRSSRPPTGSSPTPTSEARELVELYAADPGKVRRRAARASTSTLFTPGDQARGPGRGRPARGREGAALRRPDPAAQGAGRAAARRPPSCWRADPDCAAGLVVAVLGGPSGTGLAHAARRCSELAARLGIERAGPVRAAGRPRPRWPSGTAPPTSSPSRRTTSRSGWSPSRPRPAAPPSWPPPSVACRPRSATPACSSTGTTPAAGAPRWRACWTTTPAGAGAVAARPSRTPRSSAGTRTTDRLLEVYAEAMRGAHRAREPPIDAAPSPSLGVPAGGDPVTPSSGPTPTDGSRGQAEPADGSYLEPRSGHRVGARRRATASSS